MIELEWIDSFSEILKRYGFAADESQGYQIVKKDYWNKYHKLMFIPI